MAVEKLGMNQNAISRLENPYYGKATLTTLKRLAAAYDVGLLVEFVPFSRLIDRVSGTPFVDYGLSPDTMSVPSFDEEVPALDRAETFGMIIPGAHKWEGLTSSIGLSAAPQMEGNVTAPSASGAMVQPVVTQDPASATAPPYSSVLIGSFGARPEKNKRKTLMNWHRLSAPYPRKFAARRYAARERKEYYAGYTERCRATASDVRAR